MLGKNEVIGHQILISGAPARCSFGLVSDKDEPCLFSRGVLDVGSEVEPFSKNNMYNGKQEI